jgi:hypothetical protein
LTPLPGVDTMTTPPPTLETSMIGQTLSHYRVTAKLGSGGMTGFKDADWARRDPDLALLHDDPDFQRMYPPSA